MTKTFRRWDVDQGWLLPQSVHEFVPAGHIAHFVRDTVSEALDLSGVLAVYSEERGYPPYHPTMMVALLLYAYSQGVYSSRRIPRACEERMDFMAVTGLNRPDFRTISEFRKRHLTALSALFLQVLLLCRAAGLVRLGHVSIDGTKLRANASRHKAMSYGRIRQAETRLGAEITEWPANAERADVADDKQHGTDHRGDELPDWVADKVKRLDRIRAARAALEAEAAGELSGCDADGHGPDGGPPDRAQRNFTDADSRILPTRDGFIAGYNGQIAVDAARQVIVSHRLVTDGADVDGLIPLVDATRSNLGRKPIEVSADSGFASEANLEAMAERTIKAYVPPRRGRGRDEPEATPRRLKRQPRLIAMAVPSSGQVTEAGIDCASRSSSRSSARSNRHAGFGSSCCVVSKRSEANGRCFAPSTTF